MANKYTEFIQEGKIYKIRNIIYDQIVGEIRKERMGTWMHWQLFGLGDITKKEFNKLAELSEDYDGIYSFDEIQKVIKKLPVGFSNGCLKEISTFITSLYSKKTR